MGATACGGSGKGAKAPASEGGGAAASIEVGKPAPDLSIQTVNGKGKISLESLSGKIAVIDFWATWCGPCKQSFPRLEALSKRHAGKVEIVGVSVDDDDKKNEILPFAKANGASFAIGWDEGHAIANRWHVETMPTTVILDSSGTIRYVHAGFHDDEPEQIDKELLALVSETPTNGAKPKTAVASASDTPPPSASAGSSDDAAKAADDPPAAPPKKSAAKSGKTRKKSKPKKKDPAAT